VNTPTPITPSLVGASIVDVEITFLSLRLKHARICLHVEVSNHSYGPWSKPQMPHRPNNTLPPYTPYRVFCVASHDFQCQSAYASILHPNLLSRVKCGVVLLDAQHVARRESLPIVALSAPDAKLLVAEYYSASMERKVGVLYNVLAMSVFRVLDDLRKWYNHVSRGRHGVCCCPAAPLFTQRPLQ
jgi:hypothetical protein